MAKHLATTARPSYLNAARRVERGAAEIARVVAYHVVAVILINGVIAVAANAHHLPVIGGLAALIGH